ncbi:Low temperature viability protein-domain-containing protein [Suillus bovinus]|uniref:Low temperature viability protein-domain-containing protein n=1 Tax=Suillus bovinus TaxID=48563 RepID=UPI001B875551|nr:Low temperature viability protein-domain-containing protein [Suillus bovinus]KAG2138671.1 Low temperature viability protein-domain-containing protein [Suillus bovinus]
MPKKSIFRQPGAQHFQLVHRSQRDPLIHDPDASQHVLKAFVRGNDKKGKTRADLESLLSADDVAHDAHAHVGEASLYGIYFDDTEYDYMQHLRTAGAEEEGVESILIEAPATSQKSKGKGKSKDPISLRDLPPEVLPSASEIPRSYESQEAVPSSIAGFQPDMDPHLRQVLEALEDEAFVDDDLEDDFFGELVADGQRDEGDEFEYQFCEGGDTSQDTPIEDHEDPDSWEARFAQFKKVQKDVPPPSDSDDELQSEGGDTIGTLPKLPVIGGKRRRKGTSDASGYSMSSSSMYRTETLMTLDERFDQLMDKEYGSGEGEEVEEENDDLSSELSDEAPELITSREDFEAMMDDFMDNYELLGRKLKPVLPGDTGTEKLNTLRQAMGQDERIRIISADDDDNEELTDDRLFAGYSAAEKEDTWDCETVLTTYSNLENHPRVIRARASKPVPKIVLDPKTGLPTLNGDNQAPESRKGRRRLQPVAEDEGSQEPSVAKQTISRPRDESKEDKKARKQAVKAERQVRRVEKKATQEQFSTEMKHQAQGLANKAQSIRTRKL